MYEKILYENIIITYIYALTAHFCAN